MRRGLEVRGPSSLRVSQSGEKAQASFKMPVEKGPRPSNRRP